MCIRDRIYTGMRPGEKLFEELFADGEHYERTSHTKIFMALTASNAPSPPINQTLRNLEAAAHRNNRADIIKLLRELVPEFTQMPESSTEAVVPSQVDQIPWPPTPTIPSLNGHGQPQA